MNLTCSFVSSGTPLTFCQLCVKEHACPCARAHISSFCSGVSEQQSWGTWEFSWSDHQIAVTDYTYDDGTTGFHEEFLISAEWRPSTPRLQAHSSLCVHLSLESKHPSLALLLFPVTSLLLGILPFQSKGAIAQMTHTDLVSLLSV